MSGQPAARVGDPHVCPMSDGPKPHVGGVVLPAGAPTVLIGGQPAARLGDACQCVSPAPNTIAKGAFPVPIANQPAARMTDQTAHGGSITVGLPTVLIGLAGTAGNVLVGTIMCQTAGQGRTSGSTQQSYQNCGVESSRQVINQANGTNVSENGLLQSAMANGNASQLPNIADSGGTGAVGRQSILANNGVASTVTPAGTGNALDVAMSQGRGVIANLDPAYLWNDGVTQPGGGHAVTVTGVEYDDAGNQTAVYINDTGTGQCGQRVPINTWNSAVTNHPSGSPQLNITNNPIF